MGPYAIGLDIGITSVGWATVALDGAERPCGILNMGVRMFDAAEHPKDGASLAAPRREARGARRRLRRHRHRNERIRALLLSQGLLTKEQLLHLFDGQLEDIYALRVRALDEAVEREGFARILLHLAQRRGFRSNRKTTTDKEDGKILEAVNQNKERMNAKGYRTVGEMFLRDETFAAAKRNKGGNYGTTVTRTMVEDEVRAVFAAQRSFGSTFATEALEEAYLEILLSQRSFDEGPGGNSPYGGSQIENMVGHCTFYPEEPRAAKATYSFEYFNLLERVNHIRLRNGGTEAALSEAQRRAVITLAHKTEALTYAKIRKALDLPEEYTFNMVRYSQEASQEEAEKKEKFTYLKAYHQMRKAMEKLEKGHFALLSREQRNAIGRVLSLWKTSARIQQELHDAGLTAPEIEAAESIGSFSKFGHLSERACNELIPFLEQGMKYNEACAAAGFDFRGHTGQERTLTLHLKEEDLETITSPVVRRAVSQTIKVVNAIIRKEGSPTFINIELAREMAKNFTERHKIEKDMLENRAENARRMERIRTEFGKYNATGLDLVKLKLWEKQDGMCAYSGKSIPAERLFEENYAEVDHIVPYSISYDDSYKNKVLVLTKENRDKRNRLPMEYLSGQRKDDFVVWVNTYVKDHRKRSLLLKETVTEEEGARFRERNLQDTKTMAVFLKNYLEDNLLFAPSPNRKKRVTAVNGAMTAYMRKRWGIAKVRADGDLHHAVDALVIVCTTDAMIRQVSCHTALRECNYVQSEAGSLAVDPETGEVVREFPYPWPKFRKELEARTSQDPAKILPALHLPQYSDPEEVDRIRPIFVSRMPRRKVTGPAHKETIKGAKALEDGFVVVKRPLTDLKLTKDGEIKDYYNPESDRLLYEALKAQLEKFGGDGKKAFAEPFHKPKRDGTDGPVVTKVKLTEPTTLNVSVHGGRGVADNDSMVRVDVFHVEGEGYYLVPIYVADTRKKVLPSRACVSNRGYEEWKQMREEDFCFSLYPNDLVRVTHKTGITLKRIRTESSLPQECKTNEVLLYYKKCGISTASIKCVSHDDTYEVNSLGVKTLVKLEKYTVDVLGEYHKVGKEKRQPFRRK